jgi:hypothetical protein
MDGSPGRRRFAARCLLMVVGAFHLGAARGEPGTPTEYEVKAVFIYNFARYMQWPDASMPEARKTFVIGLIGKDPFGQALDDAVRDQSVQGRRIVVKRFDGLEDVGGCDILFISASEKGNLKRILAVVRTAPVLTVGDMERFAEAGGMINLTTEESRVRFEMNIEAVERVGLKASSHLLRLARIVNGTSGAK